jgi:hypothetical protein
MLLNAQASIRTIFFCGRSSCALCLPRRLFYRQSTGVLEIPVHDYEHEFGYVWVFHKKENFEIYRENSQSADIGPFFGWLCTAIDYDDEPTLSLKTWRIIVGKGCGR